MALKEARKLAVFDVNAADVVQTIPLASTNALIAAGANKLLIAFPDEQILERWDLATLRREGGSHVSPIDGWIRALALGSDSDGPALALWYPKARGSIFRLKASNTDIREPEARFSFIDLDRLTVLRAGSIDLGNLSLIKGRATVCRPPAAASSSSQTSASAEVIRCISKLRPAVVCSKSPSCLRS